MPFMPPTDSMFLLAETREHPMHVGGLQLFELPEGAGPEWTRETIESYMREVPCQACNGRRLRPEVLAVTVDGESIADVCDMPVEVRVEGEVEVTDTG